MREKLETLSLTQLRDLAKGCGIKSVTTMRKADLIEALLKSEEMQATKTEGAASGEKTRQPEMTEKSEHAIKTEKTEKTENTENTENSEHIRKTGKTEKSGNARNAGRQNKTVNSLKEKDTNKPENIILDNADDSANVAELTNTAETAGIANQVNVANPAAYSAASPYEPRMPREPKSFEEASSEPAQGILEVMPDGFGFIRCDNFLPGEDDVYVAPSQIRRFNMKTGDIIKGIKRNKRVNEKFAALLQIKAINDVSPEIASKRPNFENLTPIFPDKRIHLETQSGTTVAMRIVDLLSPIGKGQRGMIVSPPKAGKTTLLKQVAQAVLKNEPNMHIIILLIDERPEEVTDMKESVVGPQVEVIYSTFDELPERHKRVSEMVIERAKRLVEQGRDVMILLDSITRLARAYNLTCTSSGRTLSGGLDPAALHMPKKFFGAARNMREGGSLTILATALVDTGSRMDDVVFEEFKGTGNMELVLDRKLSEKRIFPAIDITKSGTRRDDLLLNPKEQEAVAIIHKATNSLKSDDAVERILELFAATKTNAEFVERVVRMRMI